MVSCTWNTMKLGHTELAYCRLDAAVERFLECHLYHLILKSSNGTQHCAHGKLCCVRTGPACRDGGFVWCGCDVFARERPFLQFSLESLSPFGADDFGWVSHFAICLWDLYNLSWWHTWNSSAKRAVFWSWPRGEYTPAQNVSIGDRRSMWKLLPRVRKNTALSVWLSDVCCIRWTRLIFASSFSWCGRRRVWWSHPPLSALSHSFTCRNCDCLHFHLVGIQILDAWCAGDMAPEWRPQLGCHFEFSLLLIFFFAPSLSLSLYTQILLMPWKPKTMIHVKDSLPMGLPGYCTKSLVCRWGCRPANLWMKALWFPSIMVLMQMLWFGISASRWRWGNRQHPVLTVFVKRSISSRYSIDASMLHEMFSEVICTSCMEQYYSVVPLTYGMGGAWLIHWYVIQKERTNEEKASYLYIESKRLSHEASQHGTWEVRMGIQDSCYSWLEACVGAPQSRRHPYHGCTPSNFWMCWILLSLPRFAGWAPW